MSKLHDITPRGDARFAAASYCSGMFSDHACAVLDLLGIGVLIHDSKGAPLFANASARAHARLAASRAAGMIRSALRERGSAVVAQIGSDQFCSVAVDSMVVTFITSDEDEPNTAITACLFELTPTERRIATLLLRGKGAPQIAAALHCSTHTVHSHLKSMFGKTQTNSQSGLIARLHGGLAVLAVKSVRGSSPSIRGCANNTSRLPSPTVQPKTRGESS